MNQPAIRILVVDDEPAIRRALRPPLMELGFQITEASRGEEALLALRAAPCDAVLLDAVQPVPSAVAVDVVVVQQLAHHVTTLCRLRRCVRASRSTSPL